MNHTQQLKPSYPIDINNLQLNHLFHKFHIFILKENNMAFVYLHKKKNTDDVFYVGIGLKENRAYSTKDRNIHWKRGVDKYGYDVEIIESDIEWDIACNKEKSLIKEYGRDNLTNMTDGGEGLLNPSEEVREKLRYPKSESHKQMLREYQIGVTQSEEWITKRLSTGFHKSAEYRNKMSIALSGENNPMKKEENKQKLRKPKPPRTKEHSKKISEATKGRIPWNAGKVMETFICEVCGKEIGGRGNLTQHQNKHLRDS